MKKLPGFTLIELVLVIAILGILAVAALPSLFGNMINSARTSSQQATAGAVQSGLSLYYANRLSQNLSITGLPANLDGVAANTYSSAAAALFVNVLQSGVTSQWIKKSDTCYCYDTNATGSGACAAGDDYYQYTPATATSEGTFIIIAAGC